jgi:hypothetical protein
LPAAKAGGSLDCGFPGLKAGASTRRAARNTSGTGAQAHRISAANGTTEVVPCHKGSGAKARLIVGCCGTTQVVPCYEAQGLKPGMVWSLGSLPSNRYIRKWPAAKAGSSLDRGFPGLKAGASTHRAAGNTSGTGAQAHRISAANGTTEVVPCHKSSGAEAWIRTEPGWHDRGRAPSLCLGLRVGWNGSGCGAGVGTLGMARCRSSPGWRGGLYCTRK